MNSRPLKDQAFFFTETPKTQGQNFRETHEKVQNLENTKSLGAEFFVFRQFLVNFWSLM